MNRNLSLQQVDRINSVDPSAITTHKTFRIWDQGGGFITAHHGTYAGGVVGAMSVFTGQPKRKEDGSYDDSSGINGGLIYKVFVDKKHRRKGLASAMLAHARARYPDIDVRHSSVLSGEGKEWAQARP